MMYAITITSVVFYLGGTLVEARWYLAVGFRVGRLPFRWQGQGILQVQGLGERGGGDNSDMLS